MPATNNAALLEKRLTLVSWFADALGYRSNAEMLESLKGAGEGWGENCHLTLERWLVEDRAKTASCRDLLQALDADIRVDWQTISGRRDNCVSLKYFQYLSALASALFLHRLKESPTALLEELQAHAARNEQLEEITDEESLCKLAFWMATGSGKTLLMHLHYKQFMRYQNELFVPDNILLVTPSEELSRQHVAEMESSGIPCFRHGESAGLLRSMPNAVRVLEITKLVHSEGKQKKGKGNGNREQVEAFSGRNLVFIDEGHKGAGGDEWFLLREKLATHGEVRGFVFEYSATFGQALSADLLSKGRPENPKKAVEYERAQSYARSILVDYSYRYFYGDGYGKNFSVSSIQADAEDRRAERLLLLGNLLAFFQQQWMHDKHAPALARHNIEKPLLLLLGGTVTGEKNGGRSDVQKLLVFLNEVASDKNENGRGWLEAAVNRLLDGQSGLSDGKEDLFADKLEPLKEGFANRAALLGELRRLLFNADDAGALRFSLLKQAPGEAMLRVGENAPFALVYVGEVNALGKLAEADGLAVDSNAIQWSLFAGAHLPASPINLLIGAKKFMTGWSSWRVSGMGLVDIGKTEGTEIIQLFGRGVRLQGENFSLKRSTAAQRASMDRGLARALEIVETLNIFAIRADFMRKFHDYITDEGVQTKPLTVPITINPSFKNENLQTLRFPPADEFEQVVDLMSDGEAITVSLDYSVQTQRVSGDGGEVAASAGAGAGEAMYFPDRIKPLLDFDSLYVRLLEHKQHKRWYNLIIERGVLEQVLFEQCRVIADEAFFTLNSIDDVRRLHNIAFALLRKYAEKVYFRAQRQWETNQLGYAPVFDSEGKPTAYAQGSFADYTIHVPQEDMKRLEKIHNLLDNEGLLCISNEAGNDGLKRLSFSRHLFLPLLLKDGDITISPAGLVPSELKFVKALIAHLGENPSDKERLFLLRNASRGKGVGFYEDEGFFPDFILWIKDGERQRIVFIEPHGMLLATKAYEKDFKARLWEKLQELTAKLQKKRQWENLSLDSYIISATPYEDIRSSYGEGDWSKDKFKQHHILFFDDKNLITTILAGKDA